MTANSHASESIVGAPILKINYMHTIADIERSVGRQLARTEKSIGGGRQNEW